MTKTYNIDLYQSHWRRTQTETFQIEATTEKEALNKARDLVKDKGIKKDYDLQVQPEPESLSTAPDSTADRNQQSPESTAEDDRHRVPVNENRRGNG